MVYDLAADLLTTATHLSAPGPRTSGEVEPVLVRAAGIWHLALGSDHTDRDLEASDVRNSKAACPKPVAPTVILLDVDPVFCGTVPLLEGAFRYGEKFSATMSAGAEWTLRLEYTMQVGPTASRGAEN